LKGGIFMYTVEEIKQKIIPIAKAHNLKSVWLIGSYARGDATEESDIDLLFDGDGSDITTLLRASAMYADMKDLFCVGVDLVDMKALYAPRNQKTAFICIRNIERDRIMLYERTKTP